MREEFVQIRFIDSIHEVAPPIWNRLCPRLYPFCRHEFLAALEDNGCTTPATGWQVAHLLVVEDEQLVAAMPGYVKTHSYGEYVFDWAWADAYRRYGMDYYPKWVSAIPFTPCTGPRLLAQNISTELITRISTALEQHCAINHYSGWHCLFPTIDQNNFFNATGAQTRLGCQFHWFNKNYQTFNDFVANMASRKRKNIMKERRQVNEQGISFLIKEQAQISDADMDLFYQLYRNTYLKRSGHNGYLSRDFFQRLANTFSNYLVMVCAQLNGTVIAAALFFRDAETLYGRYWGCFEDYQFLHFETCYYQGIEYAIANQLQRFDGGAQGEHKIARGFEPVITYSNHHLQAAAFRTAIASFLQQEAEHIHQYVAEATELLPFKQKL
jgi:hypothetical protein